ncbi:MAG TPA: Rieske 2Fe-2S domain-containing protein [Methylomirabilota bacterium]|nr:Rieske 2Fe-2S domain-containing protein [Methylomirabilota bacterium]
MLSREDNELLCRVGRGTPMGELLRQYWLPFLPSSELPAPDGPPKKVRLLGEDLVAFRDTQGRVGLMGENCPHRGASLFFGRNEECGLRCVYHGWKFDVTGRCVDMPNEPVESLFKDKVRARAYPCRDVNGVVWTYMGPRNAAPPFPAFEINTLPPEQVYPPLVMMEECNWVQALEGDIDSSHIDYVHAKLRPDSKQRGTFHRDKQPRLEVLPTDYGACYSARRRWDVDGLFWHRITQFIMPFFSMIAASDPNTVSARAWVPLDDNYNLQIMMRGRLDRAITDQEREQTRNPFTAWGGYLESTSDPRTRHYTKANIHNDYLVDRRLAREELMIGIPFLVNLQDRAMTETMGPIYDRTQEHLGTTDAMVIYVRRRLIEAARALRDQGVAPANVDDGSMCRVRPASVLLPEGDSWISATEKSRQSDSGVPIAWVPFAQ